MGEISQVQGSIVRFGCFYNGRDTDGNGTVSGREILPQDRSANTDGNQILTVAEISRAADRTTPVGQRLQISRLPDYFANQPPVILGVATTIGSTIFPAGATRAFFNRNHMDYLRVSQPITVNSILFPAAPGTELIVRLSDNCDGVASVSAGFPVTVENVTYAVSTAFYFENSRWVGIGLRENTYIPTIPSVRPMCVGHGAVYQAGTRVDRFPNRVVRAGILAEDTVLYSNENGRLVPHLCGEGMGVEFDQNGQFLTTFRPH